MTQRFYPRPGSSSAPPAAGPSAGAAPDLFGTAARKAPPAPAPGRPRLPAALQNSPVPSEPCKAPRSPPQGTALPGPTATARSGLTSRPPIFDFFIFYFFKFGKRSAERGREERETFSYCLLPGASIKSGSARRLPFHFHFFVRSPLTIRCFGSPTLAAPASAHTGRAFLSLSFSFPIPFPFLYLFLSHSYSFSFPFPFLFLFLSHSFSFPIPIHFPFLFSVPFPFLFHSFPVPFLFPFLSHFFSFPFPIHFPFLSHSRSPSFPPFPSCWAGSAQEQPARSPATIKTAGREQ